MKRILKKIKSFILRTDGPTAVEYAVLLAMLVGAMVAGITYVGDEAQEISDTVVKGVDSALTPAK